MTVSHNNPVTATDPTNTVAVNLGVADARWLSTATGKVGYAWDRVLLYAKGGGAWVATTRACSARAEIGRILTAFWIGDSTGIDSPLGGGRCRLPILLIFEVG